jgi:hypothetical protein
MIVKAKQLNGFVSAPAGTNLAEILAALRENNIHILDLAKFAPGSVKITDKLIESIRHADLVIGVLGPMASSGNVLFELGCASALDKKILIIVPNGYEIPIDLKNFLFIRTPLDNPEAIGFALDQLLHAPEQQITNLNLLHNSTTPLGPVAVDLLQRLPDLNRKTSDLGLQAIVEEMLEASGVRTQVKPKYNQPTSYPNWVVWIDELEPYFSNPILITVEETILTEQDDFLQHINNHLSTSHVRTIIVFAMQISTGVKEKLSSASGLYCFDIHEVLKHLSHKSIGEIIRDERNARVHGISQ